jgi:hypothetical protein
MFFGVSVYAVGQTLVFDILPGVPVVDPYIYIYIICILREILLQ